MIFIAIPVHNEAPTIGVLLWRLRAVFQDYAREYEVLVYDDGSHDGTAEVLAPYTKVLPLTIMGGASRIGYARAVDALLREASKRTRYPRRDAVVLMQGDFTDKPEHLPELVRRFEGGADVVNVERRVIDEMPQTERRLRSVARFTRGRVLRALETTDPFGTFRLIRLSLVRDILKSRGDQPLMTGEGWASNLEALALLRSAARRTENVELEPRYDLRPRETRRQLFRDGLALLRAGRDVRRTSAPPPRQAEPALSP